MNIVVGNFGAIRREARATFLENERTRTWNAFLDATEALCKAQEAMNEAHLAYIAACKAEETARG